MRGKILICFLVLFFLAIQVPALAADEILSQEDRELIAEMQRQISTDEMDKMLRYFNTLDRVSGSEDEARAAKFIEERLKEYGVPHNVYRFKAYLSWPIRAELTLLSPEKKKMRAITAAFSASTPANGLEGELVFVGSTGKVFEDLAQVYAGKDVKGKIVVADGLVTPQNARAAEDLGASGLVHINPKNLLHEMIVTTVWGTPTTKTAHLVPRLPVLSITSDDGEYLKQLARRGRVVVNMKTEVQTRWREIPLVVAEVKGSKEPEKFILVSSHLDSWYKGMTDTASTDASILEMARIFQRYRGYFDRSFRFAWWPGHSTGRYAGSTWYADNFWLDLDKNCIAYMNLDGPGTRGSQTDKVAAWAWPELEEFGRRIAREWTGKEPEPGYFAPVGKVFRPFRAGDSAFQGLGIPEISIGLPGLPEDHPDYAPYVGGSEGAWWWHTPEDTLDKIDTKALARDAELRMVELYALANARILPYKISAIANSFLVALQELQARAGSHLDMSAAIARAQRLKAEALDLEKLIERMNAEARAGRPVPEVKAKAINRALLRASHILNAALYTESGRFDQDRAAAIPILPGLQRAAELARLDAESDRYGFLKTEMVRERNRVEAALDEALEQITTSVRASASEKG